MRIDVGVTAIGSFRGYRPIVGGSGAIPGGGSGGGGKGMKAGYFNIPWEKCDKWSEKVEGIIILIQLFMY